MSIYELDEAKISAASENNNGKRRKKHKISSNDKNDDIISRLLDELFLEVKKAVS